MKNYIKNFSQFQKLNEQYEGGSDLANKAMSELLSINANGMNAQVDSSADSSWITDSTPESKSKMKEIFGNMPLAVIHEMGLEVDHESNGLVLSIKPFHDKESFSGFKVPLKEVSDTETTLANEEFGDAETIEMTVFTLEDGSKLAQVWIGDGFHANLPYIIGPDVTKGSDLEDYA